MHRYKSCYSWPSKWTWKPPGKGMWSRLKPLMVLGDAMSLFTMLPLTEVIKSFSWLMATSPPQGESKSVADACAAPNARDKTLMWLIYSNRTTVWDNHHMESLRTNIHPPNQCDENVLFVETSIWKDNAETEDNVKRIALICRVAVIFSRHDPCHKVPVSITMHHIFNEK